MDIGSKIADLQRQINELRRASRLSSASLDNTSLEVRDDSGSLRALVGQQADGTTAVGVPLMTPVAASSIRPAGSAGATV